MPLVRISAKILLLVSADACSHMISGNITFTTLTNAIAYNAGLFSKPMLT